MSESSKMNPILFGKESLDVPVWEETGEETESKQGDGRGSEFDQVGMRMDGSKEDKVLI